jgi:diguanylate cyclase (GGDEF)-like protein
VLALPIHDKVFIFRLISLAVMYIVLAKFMHVFFATGSVLSVFWVSSGLALAALLLGGKQLWPGIYVGAFVINIWTGNPIWVSACIAAGNTLEGLLGVWLLTRSKKLDLYLRNFFDYLRLFFLAGVIGAAVASVIGTSTLILSGLITADEYWRNLQHWWMGDILGIAFIAPLILVWRELPDWFVRRRLLEAVTLFGISFLAGQAIFLDWFYDLVGHINRGYWMYLFVSLAAVRFGLHGALLVILMAVTQALVGAIDGLGFFGTDIADTQLTNFWVYTMVLVVVGLAQATSIDERKRQATYDSLTGLPNRRLFQDRLEQELLKAQRDKTALALLFIDLDSFKEVNDTLGHHLGDMLLVAAARRIRSCVRKSDSVARLGGDEFTVILPNLSRFYRAERVATEIIDSLGKSFKLHDEVVYVSGSIGITVFPEDGMSYADLLKHADQAMYAAKNQGRNRFSYFTRDMQEQAEMHMRLATDMRSALLLNQLIIHYQPILDLSTGKITKAEALLRWNHPTLGMIGPGSFVPVAEDAGVINAIGNWVLRESALKAKEWGELIGETFCVSVNVSPIQFMSSEIVEEIIAYLDEIGLSGESLAVEITEGILLNDRPEIPRKLGRLYQAGITVGVDDFGTGYSSLSYLKKFPISQLKIDRSFVRDLDSGRSNQPLVVAIISMAHALGLKVTAEGVETESQRSFLAASGCDSAQGYLFSRAVPASIFVNLLRVHPPVRQL